MQECRAQKQKNVQNRLVRIVSVFLQSLIKMRNINFDNEMILMIQQFCVEFAKVKDANDL